MLLYIALCFATALSEYIGEQYPKWSPVYSLRMDFYEPFLDIRTPYRLWYDSLHDRVRVDNEKTTQQLCLAANLTDLAHSPLTVVQMHTDEENMNLRTCSIVPFEFRDYNILPNLKKGYVFRGKERMHNQDSAHWEKIIETDELRTEYNVWFTLKQGVFIPLKFVYKVHNTKRGILSTYFYVDIFDYDTSKIDSKIWDIGYGKKCKKGSKNDEYSIGGSLTSIELYYLQRFQNDEEHNDVLDGFDGFKLKFNKVYQSDEEHNKRLQIFKDNVKFINDHNKAGHSYKLTINQFADLTKEERAMMNGRLPRSGPSEASPFPYTAEEIERLSEDLPDHFDWRFYGAVTPIKNQASCGSCWAFSAVGAVEGALFLRDGRKQVVRLSEQALIDCSRGFANFGCMGGAQEYAYEWIKKHGLPNDDVYGGYIERDGVCNIDNVTKAVYVKDYYEIPKGDETALKVALLKHGPISVSISIGDELPFYSHGVLYSTTCNDALGHAVLLIGYGTLDGENYWLVKNSWGPNWGEAGYVLMSTKDNNCGVETDAKYVELQ